jgi:cation diffusion facilitator CzcD-associated flavoprotein CzcO
MYHDTIIIGGGQTGLALGRLLADRGHDVTILEAADQPAAAWRERWDSLRLFTPARYDSLPGKPFPGDPGSALLGWVNQDAAHMLTRSRLTGYEPTTELPWTAADDGPA